MTTAKVPGKSARMVDPNLTYVALVALSQEVRKVLVGSIKIAWECQVNVANTSVSFYLTMGHIGLFKNQE